MVLKDDGLLYTQTDTNGQTKLVLPRVRSLLLEVLHTLHDDPLTGGHLGRDATLQKVTKLFYWPQVKEFVAKYVQTCEVCQRAKTGRQISAGLLQPLPTPQKP